MTEGSKRTPPQHRVLTRLTVQVISMIRLKVPESQLTVDAVTSRQLRSAGQGRQLSVLPDPIGTNIDKIAKIDIAPSRTFFFALDDHDFTA